MTKKRAPQGNRQKDPPPRDIPREAGLLLSYVLDPIIGSRLLLLQLVSDSLDLVEDRLVVGGGILSV